MMTKRSLAAFALLLCVPALARAQNTSVPAPSAPAGSGRLSIAATGGLGAVQNAGGVLGGEIGFALSDSFDVFGEGLWMQDVVSRRRLDRAQTITSYLQSSQAKTATGTVTAPASYGGAGVRVMLTTGRIRPYVAFSVGSARVAVTPAFTLGGADITTSISQYGVSLGSDLTGDITAAVFGGGGGVRTTRGRLVVDGGIRLTSIRTPDQPTNVLRASATVGIKF